jgi:hypothetical protein
MGWGRGQKDRPLRSLFRAFESAVYRSQKAVFVAVVVVRRQEDHRCSWINAFQVQKAEQDGRRGALVVRLDQDLPRSDISQFIGVITFMGSRNDEYGSFWIEGPGGAVPGGSQWSQSGPKGAELLRTCVV